MRFSFLSFSALALSLVKAAPNGKCPHGYDKNPPAASHGNLARDVEGPAAGKKGVFLMNRIGPINSTLYIANTDGTNARKLLGNESFFEYHASFSQDGQYITFTSERLGDGNADIWRSFRNGTGLEKLVATPSVEDAGVLSPDNSKLAYVSTANGVRTNIWVKDLKTGIARNLTDTASTRGWDWSPDGHFMPAWSPDGEWIAFSSDRNTAWTGHDNGSGWEHTQELSIYAIRPNGSDFRLIAKNPGYCLGSPKWSPSGERIVYYQMTRQDTWNSHRPEDANSTVSQILSVDFSTGLDIRQETATSTLKISPQYVTKDKVGFLVKGPTNLEGIHYASNGTSLNSTYILGSMRSPAWSPDGKEVVYEVNNWTNRQMQAPLYSWDDEWDYRFTDVFPQLSPSGDQLAITQKQLGNSSVVKMNPNGSDVDLVFDTYGTGQLSSTYVVQGLAGSFQPSWSPDGKQIAVGLGFWFQERADGSAWLFNVNVANGSYEQLTFGDLNTGYPSFSHSGEEIVYRVWGSEYGLRIMNLTDKSVRVLTNGSGILNSTGDVYDNLPFYSPLGTEERIVFTRRMNYTNFDILTIRPDGTDLKVLTSSGANDAHAVWTHDGRIAYSSGSAGFRMECATYDDTFQPYGQIWIMDADGSNKRILTDSVWEDSMPLYVPNGLLD